MRRKHKQKIKFFKIKKVERGSVFTDKLMGGLRGPYRHMLARVFKAADDYAIKNKLFPATSLRVWAIAEERLKKLAEGAP